MLQAHLADAAQAADRLQHRLTGRRGAQRAGDHRKEVLVQQPNLLVAPVGAVDSWKARRRKGRRAFLGRRKAHAADQHRQACRLPPRPIWKLSYNATC